MAVNGIHGDSKERCSVADNAFCLSCRYPLRGLPSKRCPECGRPFDLSDPTSVGWYGPGVRARLRAWAKRVASIQVAIMALSACGATLLGWSAICWFFVVGDMMLRDFWGLGWQHALWVFPVVIVTPILAGAAQRIAARRGNRSSRGQKLLLSVGVVVIASLIASCVLLPLLVAATFKGIGPGVGRSVS